MCKYKMDPTSIVEDTERTRFCPQTDGRTDGRTRWNQYTPFQLRWSGGIIITSLWNLTDTSAAVLSRCLSNFRAIGQFQIQISRHRDFTRSYNKTCYRILQRGPCYPGHCSCSSDTWWTPLHWCHDERYGVWNHRRLGCFNRLFRRRSKKISKLRVIGRCEGNPPATGGFPY